MDRHDMGNQENISFLKEAEKRTKREKLLLSLAIESVNNTQIWRWNTFSSSCYYIHVVVVILRGN